MTRTQAQRKGRNFENRTVEITAPDHIFEMIYARQFPYLVDLERDKRESLFASMGLNPHTIEIDLFIKPAVLHLWDRGIVTVQSCAGHCPDYHTFIEIERNQDFENYSKNSPWEMEIRPIQILNPLFYAQAHIEKTENKKDGIHHYWTGSDHSMFVDTDKTVFTVAACHSKGSRERRRLFLKWLLNY